MSSYQTEWARNNKDKVRAAQQRYYNSQQGQWKSLDKVAKRYGIVAEDYAWMLNKQDCGCAICGTHYTNTRDNQLVIDHCHSTGKVRGLLCHKCNSGHGQYSDNLTVMCDSAEYVATHRNINDLIKEAISWHE